MRQLNLHRLPWLFAAFAITVIALVAPLSAATFSRRARAVHARGQLSRGVQTSRLGICGDAIEGGAGEAGSSDALLGASLDHHTETHVNAPCGVIPRLTESEFSTFVTTAAAFLTPIRDSFITIAAPRGPPIS